MNQQFVLTNGTVINLVQLPPGVGAHVVTVPKTAWNKIAKGDLIGEAQFRGHLIDNRTLKSSIVDSLTNYYRTNNFGSGKLPLNSYLFQEGIARAIVTRVYNNIPNISHIYKRT